MPPNLQLQLRREAMPSQIVPGRCMNRAELAEAVNAYLWRTRGERRDIDAHTIARYERGAVRWPNEGYREAFRTVLGASDAELGFAPKRERGSERYTSFETNVSFFTVPGNSSDLEAVRHGRPRSPGRAGMTEVAEIRNATTQAASSENLYGGGFADSFAAEQLRRYAPLTQANVSARTRAVLLEAIGNLGAVAGYAAFDAGDYPAADRNFGFALRCAEAAGSWQLRASTLADMARKAAYIGNFDYALTLIELAQVRTDRLTTTGRAMLCTLRAQYLAATGRIHEALEDVAWADEQFDTRTPSEDPPWLCFYDHAEHLGSTGKALVPVARTRKRLEPAASRIRAAIELQEAGYPRSRTFSLTRLATLTMQLGDPIEAAELSHEAVEKANTLNSRRLWHELRHLAAASSPHRRIGRVAELREAILTP